MKFNVFLLKVVLLPLGNGHYNLTDEAPSVKFAGELFFDSEGKIYRMTNNSGHYQSNKEKLEEAFGALGRSIGHTFSDAVDLEDFATGWQTMWIR